MVGMCLRTVGIIENSAFVGLELVVDMKRHGNLDKLESWQKIEIDEKLFKLIGCAKSISGCPQKGHNAHWSGVMDGSLEVCLVFGGHVADPLEICNCLVVLMVAVTLIWDILH